MAIVEYAEEVEVAEAAPAVVPFGQRANITQAELVELLNRLAELEGMITNKRSAQGLAAEVEGDKRGEKAERALVKNLAWTMVKFLSLADSMLLPESVDIKISDMMEEISDVLSRGEEERRWWLVSCGRARELQELSNDLAGIQRNLLMAAVNLEQLTGRPFDLLGEAEKKLIAEIR